MFENVSSFFEVNANIEWFKLVKRGGVFSKLDCSVSSQIEEYSSFQEAHRRQPPQIGALIKNISHFLRRLV